MAGANKLNTNGWSIERRYEDVLETIASGYHDEPLGLYESPRRMSRRAMQAEAQFILDDVAYEKKFNRAVKEYAEAKYPELKEAKEYE